MVSYGWDSTRGFRQTFVGSDRPHEQEQRPREFGVHPQPKLDGLSPSGNFGTVSVFTHPGMQAVARPWSLCRLIAALCGGLVVVTAATPGQNPYVGLTNRNAFGIRPPPEPEPPPVVAPPPAAPPNIFLTGVSHTGGQKKAYFAINRPGGKQQEYETLREGEELQDLKVMEIDAKAGRVRALVNGKEVSLTFTENGLKAVAGSGLAGAPGAAPRPGQPIATPVAPVPSPISAAGGSGPVVIGRGGVTLNPGNQGSNPAIPGSAATYSPGNVQPDGSPQSIPLNRPLPIRSGAPTTLPVNDTVQPVDTGGRIPLPLPPQRTTQ